MENLSKHEYNTYELLLNPSQETTLIFEVHIPKISVSLFNQVKEQTNPIVYLLMQDLKVSLT